MPGGVRVAGPEPEFAGIGAAARPAVEADGPDGGAPPKTTPATTDGGDADSWPRGRRSAARAAWRGYGAAGPSVPMQRIVEKDGSMGFATNMAG